MPVFNLELKFDDKGALQAVRKIEGVAGAANDATDAVNKLGKSASSNGQALSRMGSAGGSAADAIANKMKKAAAEVLALVGAFKAVQGAMDFMNRGLEFNANLEQSQIGIASLITSMVKLEDAQGKVLEGADKYQAAQGMAAELMEKINILGLKTTADSQSIVEGFQAILAPALQAGMALEKIPEFAIAGAQALQTMGLPLNQMKFELEALLSGNINLAQDVLAPRLFSDVQGNLKEYIQGLKQAGKLEEEIFKRLEPYNLALKDTENTWAAISSNLGEAIDKLAGDTSLNYTKAMKQSLSDINNLIIDTKTGKIGKDFEQIANLLADIQDWIGNKIVASVQTLIGYTKEINKFLGTDMGKSTLEAFTTAVKLASGALAGLAAARTLAFAKDKGASAIDAAKKAMDSYKQATIAAAQAQKQAIVEELNKVQAYRKSEQGQRQLMSSWQAREAMLAREVQLSNQVVAANKRLVAAQNMSTAKMGLAGALKGIVNFMGGPFNAAMIAGGTAIATLATMQTNAEKAADLHASALQRLNEVQQAATELGKQLADQLNEVAEANRRIAIDEATEAIRNLAIEILKLDFSAATGFLPDFREEAESLDEMVYQLANGQGSFEEFTKSLASFYNRLNEAGEAGSRLGKRIKEALDLAAKGVDAETVLRKLRGEIDATTEKVDKSVSVVQEANKVNADYQKGIEYLNKAESNNVNTLEGALKWLEKRNSTTEEGKKIQEAMAKATDLAAVATLNAAIATAEFNAAAANTALLGENITDEMIRVASEANTLVVKLTNARDIALKGMASPNWGESGKGGKGKKTGGGSSSKIENAGEKWKELTQQLAQLEGKSTSSRASLDKTLKSIEDTGKAAKKSASEISDMQKAFIAASDKKALQELNKELLQLEGNTKELQQIERQEKTDQLKAKIADIRGLSEDERNILLNRVEEGVQREQNVKDLQTSVDFFKELESLGGEYGQSLELQNQLIENQAALYRDALKPEFQGYVDEWQRLKQLSNDKTFMSGLTRGLRKFGADYGDVANQVEQFTTNMGSHISNTLADAFMKGKFSAQDFFNSLISMAAQAASNAFIGQIFSGIGSAFGGMFGGGANYSASQTATMSANGMQSGFGGWLTGVHGHHKGGIVGRDYTFKRDMPLSAFFGAPRLHSGGGFFRWGEYPAILKAGERVLNPAETKAYNAGQSSMGGWNASPIVNVKVVNESGNPVDAQSQATPNGMGGFDLDIIISQVEQGIVSRAKQGKSQLMQYQQTAYGLDRANVLARGRGRA